MDLAIARNRIASVIKPDSITASQLSCVSRHVFQAVISNARGLEKGKQIITLTEFATHYAFKM